MRATIPTTRHHSDRRITASLKLAIILIAATLALCLVAGCDNGTGSMALKCVGCDKEFSSANEGSIHDCNHFFCSEAACAEIRENEHAAAECGIAKHWACRSSHEAAPCGLDGHSVCDSLKHEVADCQIGGHFKCDEAEHSLEKCLTPSAEPAPSLAPSKAPTVSTHTHSGGEATCLKQAICTGCGKTYGSTNASKHDARCAFKPASACTHTHGDACRAGGYHNESACSCGASCKGGDYVSSNGETSWAPCSCGCWVESGCSHSHDASCGYSAGTPCSA